MTRVTKKKEQLDLQREVKVAERMKDVFVDTVERLIQDTPANKWEGLFPTVVTVNKTNPAPIDKKELRVLFDVLCEKELQHRKDQNDGIPSPLGMTDSQKKTINWNSLGLVVNDKGAPYKDMENVTRVLRRHPKYKDNIRMDIFRQEIQTRLGGGWVPYDDGVLLSITHDMQNLIGMRGVAKEHVHDAVSHVAMDNIYDEPKEWLSGLTWDGTPRLETWLMSACGADDDAKGYHRAVGAGWLMGLVRRLTDPGCTWDYILTLYGIQGVGKTSVFRILGGDWYTAYTGDMGNKDFYLSMRGTAIMDLDEGVTTNKADASKLKSVATLRRDTYRAPYDKTVKTYPRRFVFSMSTNQVEHLKDETGNRRFWTVECKQVNFKWLEESREQLFAEAYHNVKNDIPAPALDVIEATRRQEEHVTEDPWTAVITNWIIAKNEYRSGTEGFMVSSTDIYTEVLKEVGLSRMEKRHEVKIGNILRGLGFEKVRRMVDGTRIYAYSLTITKSAELKALNLPPNEGLDSLF